MHWKDDEDYESDPIGWYMTHPLALVQYLLMIVAVYISFQRNEGFSIGPFFAALLFSPLYLLYAYAMPIAKAMPAQAYEMQNMQNMQGRAQVQPVEGGYYYDY